MRRTLAIAAALVAFAAAPALAQQEGSNYVDPGAIVSACVFYSPTLTARSSAGAWNLGCDSAGNLRVTLGAGAGTSSGNPLYVTTTPSGSGTMNVAVTSPLTASGAVETASCDPTTAATCAPVNATYGSEVYITLALPAGGNNIGSVTANLAANSVVNSTTSIPAYQRIENYNTTDVAYVSSIHNLGVQDCDATTAARCQTVLSNGQAAISPYGLALQAPFVLTAASTQTCTAISTTAALVSDITNANTSAQTATLTLFNDNGSCAAGNKIVAIVLGASQTVTFGPGKYFSTAASYTLSAAAAANISIGYAK